MILYFITRNKHKLIEIDNILKQIVPTVQLQIFNNVRKIEIQHNNLREIVKFAVQTATRYITNKPFIIEDAGLFINALKGFPGPFSHYVYKTIGIKGILKLMENVENRTAYFKSVIGLYFNDDIHIFEGVAEGVISRKARGEYGFGFDPIFIPQGCSKTFAEMRLEEKNMHSHRGKSARALALFLKETMPTFS